MRFQIIAAGLLLAGQWSCASAFANAMPQIADTAAASPATAARTLTLPADSEVILTPIASLSTKLAKVGDTVALTTVFDVRIDGYLVIPRGTPAQGTVTFRTGTGAFGKSGKMEIRFDSVTIGGQPIPLEGTYRTSGEGNSGAALGAVLAVGVFAAFVKGHSAAITNGDQLRARTATAATFAVAATAPQIQTATMVAANGAYHR